MVDMYKLFHERTKIRPTTFACKFFSPDHPIPRHNYRGLPNFRLPKPGTHAKNIVFSTGSACLIHHYRTEKLGFGKCRLSMAVRRGEQYKDASFLEGKRIATSYPVIVESFLREKGVNAEIHEISGSVEIAPGIGLADAICDLVSSGSTLFMNGLQEAETILQSQAVLIRNNELDPVRVQLLDRLLFRIQSVKKAKKQ